MTLGNELKKYVPAGKTQKTVALELAEALRAAVGLQYSPDTAESRWSEALKGKLTGLRFFFESEKRMETSLGALGVPSAEVPRLRQLIRGAMGGQTVLLDLTSTERLSAPLYGELRTWLLSVEDEMQVVVGLTDAQYDAAPASFRECGARFERGDFAKLRETAAIIVSEELVRPVEKWLAVSFGSPLVFSPANWRERLQEGADLGAPPTPLRPARLIAEADETRNDRLPRGARLRELMFSLASGREDPFLTEIHRGRTLGARLALGNMLGVGVEATQEEWDQKRFEGLKSVSAGELPKLLLGARLTGARLMFRVGDKVHLVNPTDSTRHKMQSLLHAPEDVVVHSEELNTELFVRELREAATQLTQDQVSADPWLDSWLEARYPEKDERLIARDALAWLSRTNQLKFRDAAPVTDWRASLRKLIPEVPAKATLLFEHSSSEFFLTVARQRLGDEALDDSQFRPVSPLLVSREDSLLYSQEFKEPSSSVADWAAQLQKRIEPRPAWEKRDRGDSRTESVKANQWEEADELLARVLDSLAFNVSGSAARITQDGWVHLLLGGGVIVRLQVRQAETSEPRGSFLVSGPRSALTQRIVTHAAGGDSFTRVGPFVPIKMRLSGAGLAADLSFSASALLGAPLSPDIAAVIARDD